MEIQGGGGWLVPTMNDVKKALQVWVGHKLGGNHMAAE